jgi:hypothetical protein
MSVESKLKLAEYFEGRAKRERRDKLEHERLLAVARAYRAEADAERERSVGRQQAPRQEVGDSDPVRR